MYYTNTRCFISVNPDLGHSAKPKNTGEIQTCSQSSSETSLTSAKSPSTTTWHFVVDKDDGSWIENKSQDDELKSLFRSIKNAKMSIFGKRILDPPERLRAMTSAQTSRSTKLSLKLNALERALKVRNKSSCVTDVAFL